MLVMSGRLAAIHLRHSDHAARQVSIGDRRQSTHHLRPDWVLDYLGSLIAYEFTGWRELHAILLRIVEPMSDSGDMPRSPPSL